MTSPSKPTNDNPDGLSLNAKGVIEGNWSDALKALSSGTDMESTIEFLCRTADIELYDYTPLERYLQKLTTSVHEQMTDKVKVIPRGSFVSGTVLTNSADLDIDLVIPEDYLLIANDPESAIKTWLGVKPDVGTIEFNKDALIKTLSRVWEMLEPNVDSWLARKTMNFSRSIPARTKEVIPYLGGKKLDIDIFLKVLSRRGPYEYIVGVDKDGPEGLRRITTTEYIPIEGTWRGDRTLHPAERMAIIMLKWWKNEEGLKIKSHHLLTALNALQDLNEDDDLWFPINVSTPYSNVRVMDIMSRILVYLYRTYNCNPCAFMLKRKNEKGTVITDYPFPEQSRTIQDELFIQYNQDQGGDTASIQKVKEVMLLLLKQLEEALKAALKGHDAAVKKLREYMGVMNVESESSG